MMDEHSFSVQLTSKDHVKNVCLSEGSEILFDGYLGYLKGIEYVDDSLIEIRGSKGVLRFDLTLQQVHELLKPRKDGP